MTINEYCQHYGLTYTELARRIGVKYQTFYEWTKGKRASLRYKGLLDGLGITHDYYQMQQQRKKKPKKEIVSEQQRVIVEHYGSTIFNHQKNPIEIVEHFKSHGMGVTIELGGTDEDPHWLVRKEK